MIDRTMKTFRRIAMGTAIVVVSVVAALNVARAKKAKADAAFIAAANLQTWTLTVDGVERQALVHVPSAYDGKVALPVVMMFHGSGGTAESVVKETGWVAKSDVSSFIVVFPEATRPDMTQPPKFGRNNPAWNDGSGRFHAGERNIADVAFIAALLDHLEAKFVLDKRRVFATGFSNGASMAFRVGLEPKIARPVSLLYITGTADPINPMEGGAPKMASGAGFKGVPEKAKPPVREMVKVWVKLLGCEPEAKPISSTIEGITTVVHTGGRDGTEVVFTTIEGHGHIWPGGKSPLPAFILGKATSRLNANDAVWDFFQAHPKPDSKP